MKKHNIEVRVRYAETDKMGIVYHTNHFVWFEVARTEFFRALGLPYSELEEKGYFLPVLKAHCEYKSHLGYDDEATVTAFIAAHKGTRISFHYEVRNKSSGKLVATGYTVHAFMNSDGKPVKIPEEVLKAIGESME